MPRSRSSTSLWLLLLCVLWGAQPVQAKSTKDFQQHYDRAIELYQGERYTDAIKEFTAAYAIKQLPRVLFNIGQAHLKLGEAKEALGFYERYLQLEPKPPPELQSKLEASMAQARSMLNAMSTPPVEPDKPPEVTPPPDKPPEPEPPPVVAPPPPPVPPPPPPSRRPRPRWRIIAGAAGLGVGLLMVGFGASALAIDNQCIDTAMPGKSCSFDFDTLGPGVGLVVPGALLTVAGGVLLAVPGPRRDGK